MAVDWDKRGHVLASCHQQTVYCRVVGLGNSNNCGPFRDFSDRMQAQGCAHFILDFSSCEGVDSTFLGVLLGIAMSDGPRRPEVVVVNATRPVRRVLGEVGIDHLVQVCRDDVELPDIPLSRLEPTDATDADRIGMMLTAHENLCRLEGDNVERFGNFLRLLRAELAGRSGKSGDQ